MTYLPEQIRPGRRPFIALALIGAIPICLYTYIGIVEDTSVLKVALMLLSIALLVCVWTYLHTIYLYTDRVSYVTLFSRMRTVHFEEVARWSIRVGVFKYLDRFKPTVRLEIEPVAEAGKKPIVIAIRLFRKEDIDKVISALPEEKEDNRSSRKKGDL